MRQAVTSVVVMTACFCGSQSSHAHRPRLLIPAVDWLTTGQSTRSWSGRAVFRLRASSGSQRTIRSRHCSLFFDPRVDQRPVDTLHVCLITQDQTQLEISPALGAGSVSLYDARAHVFPHPVRV